MTLSSLGSAQDRTPSYRYTAGGTKVLFTRKAPGIVTVTTPGDHHVLVDHVSYYFDGEVHLFADGSHRFVRWHLVYRFGNQADPVDAAVEDGIRVRLLGICDELFEKYGSEIGSVALDDVDAADRLLLADLNRQITQVQHFRAANLAKIERSRLAVSEAETEINALVERMDEVRVRIESRSPAN